jgi:chromate transporter
MGTLFSFNLVERRIFMDVKSRRKLLFLIFWTFFKISPVTFGGGFAMIPLFIKEIVEKRKWLTNEDITDVIALSQTVPGAVAINSATFIGHRIGGIGGAISAMIGVSLPTFIIVLILGISYFYVHDNPKLEAAFVSIRVTIVAIIVYAAIKIAKTAIIDKTTFFIMVAGVPVLFFIHPIIAIFLGAITGIIATLIKKKLGYNIELEKNKEDDPTNNPDYYMGAGI